MKDIKLYNELDSKEAILGAFDNYNPFYDLPIDKVESKHKFLYNTLNLIRRCTLDNIFSSKRFYSFLDFIINNIFQPKQNEKNKIQMWIFKCIISGKPAELAPLFRNLFFKQYVYLFKKDFEKIDGKNICIQPQDFGLKVLLMLDKYLDGTLTEKQKESYLFFVLNSGYINSIVVSYNISDFNKQQRKKKSDAGKKSGAKRGKPRNEGYKIWKEKGLNKFKTEEALSYFNDLIKKYNVTEKTITGSWFKDYRKRDINNTEQC